MPAYDMASRVIVVGMYVLRNKSGIFVKLAAGMRNRPWEIKHIPQMCRILLVKGAKKL